jgi:hypothetical protein
MVSHLNNIQQASHLKPTHCTNATQLLTDNAEDDVEGQIQPGS